MSKKLGFLIITCLVGYFTGCGGKTIDQTSNNLSNNTPDPMPTVAEKPTLAEIKKFETSPKDAEKKPPNSPIEICYEVTSATKLEIQTDDGEVKSLASLTADCNTFTPEKSVKYTLIATGEDRLPNKKTIEVKVSYPDIVIEKFEVSPKSVEAGGRVKACYKVSSAKRIFIFNQEFSKAEDCVNYTLNFPVRPFVLTALNPDSEKKLSEPQNVEVLAAQQAKVTEFKADPSSVLKNASANLCFTATYGSQVRISNVKEIYKATGQHQCITVKPQTDTEYRIQARGASGNVDEFPQAQTITVKERAGSVTAFFPRYNVQSRRFEICYEVFFAKEIKIKNSKGLTPDNLKTSGQNCITNFPPVSDRYTMTGTGNNGAALIPRTFDVKIPEFAKLEACRSSNRLGISYSIPNSMKAQVTGRGVFPINLPVPGNSLNCFVLPPNFNGKSVQVQAFSNVKDLPPVSRPLQIQ